jgi:tetratricopeptide (TPR) repeat protein
MKNLCLCLLLLTFLGCGKSAQKSLQQGNYDDAVITAVEKLRKSPENRNALEALRDAYPLALRYHTDNIKQAEVSNDRFRWDAQAKAYTQLNRLAEEIRRCPSCLNLLRSPQQFLNEEQNARERAASEHYEAGLDALAQRDNREVARQAYDHFEAVKNFVPTYRDVENRLNEAYFYASLKVVVEQAKLNSRIYQYSNEFFQGKINEFLATNRRLNKFVRFYSPEEAKADKVTVADQIVRLEFDDFVVGQTFVNTKTETVWSADSVVVGSTKVNGKNIDVKNKVKADLTINRKSVVSKGLLNLLIVDGRTGKVLLQEQVPGEHTWNQEWGSFNGDERALTDTQKRISQNREQLPPPPQQLFVEFCRPIYDSVTYRIRRFYEKY